LFVVGERSRAGVSLLVIARSSSAVGAGSGRTVAGSREAEAMSPVRGRPYASRGNGDG
jgi:hypothetical protein